MFFQKRGAVFIGVGDQKEVLQQHLHMAACHNAARWGVLRNTSPSVSYFLFKFSYFIFFLILVRSSCFCLADFLSSDFFKFGVPGKVWSYDCRYIASARELTQCRKFCNTFLGKLISLNL